MTKHFTIRLDPTDVSAIKQIAREQSARRGKDIRWTTIIRGLMREYANKSKGEN